MKIPPELKALIKKAVSGCAKEAGIKFPYEITVSLTDNAGIRELNAAHRDVDAPTDVLSFPLLEFEDGLFEPADYDFNPDTGNVELGDIVISVEKAEAQAKEYGHTIEREMAFLASHGALHLFGYDHDEPEGESAMNTLTEIVLARMGLSRTGDRQ
jgi:probable rRNA maturation factor